MPPQRVAAKIGVTYDEVRRMARDFPGIEESTSYGTPALKVRGTLLLRLREDGETAVLKTTFVERDLLLQADPEVYYVTDHYRNYPYVLVRLPRIRPHDLRDRLEDSWHRLASKGLIAEFEQNRDSPARVRRKPDAGGKRK
jgi:hypothetical protein